MGLFIKSERFVPLTLNLLSLVYSSSGTWGIGSLTFLPHKYEWLMGCHVPLGLHDSLHFSPVLGHVGCAHNFRYFAMSNTLLCSRQHVLLQGIDMLVAHDDGPQFSEKVALQRLGKKIGKHLLRRAIYNFKIFQTQSVFDPEVSDVNVP